MRKGHRSQLDYILTSKIWVNSVKDCIAYDSFCTVGSGHRILSYKAKISYRATKLPPKNHTESLDWIMLYKLKIDNLF